MKKHAESELERVRAMSEEEVERAAREDPDARPWTDEELSRAVLVRMEDFLPRAKRAVSLRLDADVLDWFKSQGRGWQTRMNAVLKAYKEAHNQRRPG